MMTDDMVHHQSVAIEAMSMTDHPMRESASVQQLTRVIEHMVKSTHLPLVATQLVNAVMEGHLLKGSTVARTVMVVVPMVPQTGVIMTLKDTMEQCDTHHLIEAMRVTGQQPMTEVVVVTPAQQREVIPQIEAIHLVTGLAMVCHLLVNDLMAVLLETDRIHPILTLVCLIVLFKL